ncbi:MAG: GNAT family N-acetyltransferase [Anaerolineales bacterium]|jgi:putative acetyltransferase
MSRASAGIHSLGLHTDRRSDKAPTFQGLERELASLPGVYAPPSGRLLLARQDSRAAGCIALKGHDAATGELKRLFVRPAFRGHKIGRQLVAALIEAAREQGYRRLVLGSHISMKSAHALYQAAGFHKVDTPSDFPENLKPLVVFMEMDLAEAQSFQSQGAAVSG